MATFKTVYEDNHLLVVDKPSMLPTMGVGPEEESLVSLAKVYIGQKYNKPGKVYLGVVSRLDAWVSGLIVLARTSKSADRLNRQFRDRRTGKTYWAIIPDKIDLPEEGRLENHLVKNESFHRMEVLPSGSKVKGDFASLTFRTLGRNAGLRLISINLETGRKHQIRVQFSAIGCPIVGDGKYHSELRFPVGIGLHSAGLTLEHPILKSELSFESKPPGYWRLERFGYDLDSLQVSG